MRASSVRRWIVAGIAYGVFLASGFVFIQHGVADGPAGPRADLAENRAVILAINDVYRIEGARGGRLGGLARLRTIRAELEKAYPDLIFVHGGDVISPSFLGRMYAGRQMIDILNLMDGDASPSEFDERMFVVFGNHEFDDSRCADPTVIRNRVGESKFYWISSNIAFDRCPGEPPMLAAPNLLGDRLIEAGGIRVGLFGLTIDPKYNDLPEFRPPVETARRLSKKLRGQGADVVIALTHLEREEDVRIIEKLGRQGPDFIIGGHDHERMRVPVGGMDRVLKADSDAVSASIIFVTLGPDGAPKISHRFRELDRNVPRDPAVQKKIESWLDTHAKEFCEQRELKETCLADEIGKTKTLIEGEENKIRSRETSLGNWVTDRMLAPEEFREADAAMINSGVLRLNDDIDPDTTITRRHIEELFGYPVPVYRRDDVTGSTLWKAIARSLAGRGSGAWLQVSNMAVVVGEQGLERLLIKRSSGDVVEVTERSSETFSIVANGFLLCGGDGYDMLRPKEAPRDVGYCMRDLEQRQHSVNLKDLVLNDLTADEPIAPKREGRVCKRGAEPCLADDW